MGPPCWICLSSDDGPAKRCACATRVSHAACLSMWRAFCVGADEERACRFCGGVYPGSWTDDVFPADRRPFLEVCVGDRTEIFDVVDDDATSFRKRLADTFETDDSTSNIAFRISDAISADGWHRLDAFLDRVNTHMGNVVAAVAAA